MMENKAHNWIIGCSGNEWDNVTCYRVYGTKDQVKKHLARLVRESKKEYGDNFEYGDTKASDVTERHDGTLYAAATMGGCHEDYTATPEEKVLKLDDKGKY